MQRFVNNFFAQLTGALAAGGAVLPISTEAAAKLPMASGDHYLLTLVGTLDPSQQTVVEIVKATPGAGGTITIERAQESTGSATWPAGTWVFCSMTAGTLGGLFSTLATQSDAIADQAELISQLQGDISEQAALINQQHAALQDLQDRVTVLEGGTVPDGVLLDGSGNYLVDGQGNNLTGA